MKTRVRNTLLVLGLATAAVGVAAEPPAAFNPQIRMAAQRTAMEQLKFLDGEWRGPAWSIDPSGKRHDMVQTERVGTLLDGTVRLVEGRGYAKDGSTLFNALAVISFDPVAGKLDYRAHAMGFASDFKFEATADGFKWEVPMGPQGTTYYSATVKDGIWHETGERAGADGKRTKVFEMTLKRVGDSSWPAGTPVSKE